MEIFINEVSLQSQYQTEKEFINAVTIFIGIFKIIEQKITKKTIYKENSQVFINYEAIAGENFQKSINNLKDKSLYRAFRAKISNKANPKEWRKEQQHKETDNFDCVFDNGKIEDVKNTSIAEITERKLLNNNKLYLLINFQNSKFNRVHEKITDCHCVKVIKNNEENQPIFVDCLDKKSALENWFNFNFDPPYDVKSNSPPTDEQTILIKSNKFNKTKETCQGRSIYQEIGKNRYWYVDNLHYGKTAHLEVFDKHRKHLGEADLEGNNIDGTKKDKKKSI